MDCHNQRKKQIIHFWQFMKVLKTQQATAVAFSTFHKQRVASIKEDLFAISSDW